MTQRGIRSPDRFQGVERPASLEMSQIALQDATLGRLKWQHDDNGIPVQLEQADGYMICYQRNHLPARPRWIDGKPATSVPLDPGEFLLLDLRRRYSAVEAGDIDCVSIFASHASIAEFHHENDLAPFSTLRDRNVLGHSDAIVRNLMECFVPAFEEPAVMSRLFLDHLTITLLSHLTTCYGEQAIEFRTVRGGLAPWQVRRVKDLLLANLKGDIGLDVLAKETGLSRAHLARSFKISTGRSPMMWLQHQRLEKAMRLLLVTGLTVQAIAEDCGFVDHSHFTKVFSRYVNATPGEWRRKHKM
ncbi:AraC family transcriptional regulator [Rhizobium sp. S152]|uniref:AraC family transcriptional regulator n=1 Tax=Rhizobium sp. S152 TaxID=3055038 RepID=UPI0025A97D73|nr:AraC family transcriptional regulator [Rhizobium sp. S152]MDM9628338.1 AraC family transcriptional regulator [Rhizobium sp. S152]